MSKVSETIREMIFYFDGDNQRINHSLKVYGFAKSIGELEGLESDKLEILELAAVLHDIGIKESERKYSSAAGKYQELEGPPVTADILGRIGTDPVLTERVCFLVGHHHTYGKIDDIDFQILVEADFLVNIFEGSMRVDEIRSVKSKYFKTNAGVSYLESMFLKEDTK